MPWNDGVWNDTYWNDTVYVPPVPPIIPTATTIQLGNLILGQGSDPDADGVLWDWTWLDGWWDTASVRVEQSEVQAMGVVQTAGRVNGRALSLRGIAHTQHVGSKLGTLIFGANRTLKRNMWLPDKYATLTVNEPGLSLTAVVTAAQPIRVQDWHENGRAWMEFEVPLLAPDPRRYETVIHQDTQSTVAVNSIAATTMTNDGDMPTPPTFTIEGPMSTLVITNAITGNPSIVIDFAGNFALGDTAVIDTVNPSLTIDGTNFDSLIQSFGWFALAPGDNDLTFTYTGAQSLTHSGIFTTKWRSAWS